MISFEQWCKTKTNIVSLVRSLSSSVPEQYIGFYLHQVFEKDIEYEKWFDWLGHSSIDIYIPSLKLAIEYDGEYYHSHRRSVDAQKDALCYAHDIYLIRIREQKQSENISKKENEILYCYAKNYANIAKAINDLLLLINKKYNIEIKIDVDLMRDKDKILLYVQNKHFLKSIACVWPEVKEYWDYSLNPCSIFDVFYTDSGRYKLKCPYCGKIFDLHMRYCHDRKSLIPCECEYKEIEVNLKKAINDYKEYGILVVLDDTLQSRRLYDRMQSNIRYFLSSEKKEEIEMYIKLGFESPRLNLYYSIIKRKNNT